MGWRHFAQEWEAQREKVRIRYELDELNERARKSFGAGQEQEMRDWIRQETLKIESRVLAETGRRFTFKDARRNIENRIPPELHTGRGRKIAFRSGRQDEDVE